MCGLVLTVRVRAYPGIYRPRADQTAYLPLMFAGILVGDARRGVDLRERLRGRQRTAGRPAVRGRDRAADRRGYVVGVNYGIMRIGKTDGADVRPGWLGEWLLVGMAIGLVYKPVAGAVRRAAGV